MNTGFNPQSCLDGWLMQKPEKWFTAIHPLGCATLQQLLMPLFVLRTTIAAGWCSVARMKLQF